MNSIFEEEEIRKVRELLLSCTTGTTASSMLPFPSGTTASSMLASNFSLVLEKHLEFLNSKPDYSKAPYPCPCPLTQESQRYYDWWILYSFPKKTTEPTKGSTIINNLRGLEYDVNVPFHKGGKTFKNISKIKSNIYKTGKIKKPIIFLHDPVNKTLVIREGLESYLALKELINEHEEDKDYGFFDVNMKRIMIDYEVKIV
jgi:hypothetical protein